MSDQTDREARTGCGCLTSPDRVAQGGDPFGCYCDCWDVGRDGCDHGLDEKSLNDAVLRNACAFCEIVAGRAPAEYVSTWPDAIAIRPLNPVTDGHALVIPRVHVSDAAAEPEITGIAFRRAAALIAGMQVNLITSVGEAATQTVRHLHVHIVPRSRGDGLALPWTAVATAPTPRSSDE
jgi:histidine triad (HIT) family protein